MKVGDLIAALQKLDPHADVICYTEDSAFVPKKHMFRVLEIDAVDLGDGERCRGDDGIATLKIAEGPHSEKLAIISVTADF